MMDSNNNATPFSWPAFGAGFSQPYNMEVSKSLVVPSPRTVHAQLTDWGTPVHEAARPAGISQHAAGTTYEEIPLTMEVVIGQAQLPVSALMSLTRDQVILLNKRFGEPVEIRVNGQTIGKGEIVSDHHDNIIGVKLTEVSRA